MPKFSGKIYRSGREVLSGIVEHIMYFDIFEALAPTILDCTACVLEVVSLFNLLYPPVVIGIKARRYVFN